MRVLIVNTFYYPNMQGGAEQSVKLLAENFLKHGNTVAIYCADAKDGKKTVEEINGPENLIFISIAIRRIV